MKIVFDTNVLISATQWDGSVAQKLLFILIKQNLKIYSSTQIILEYQKVLKRDFEYTEGEIAHMMEKVLHFITLVEPTKKINLVKEDPEDNHIIECAIESQAQYIIAYDNDLLRIKEYNGIKIITPETALKITFS